MHAMVTERAFTVRHGVINLLRQERELGHPLTISTDDVQALLEEISLLQVIAQAAENVASFPQRYGTDAPLARLGSLLRRWKE